MAFMALSSPLGDGVLAIGPRPHPPLGGDWFAQSPSNGGWGLGPMALTSSSWGEIGFARRTATPFVGQTPRGVGVLALMAKASSSMGDRRVDRPLACGVLTVPWRVTCGVFLLSFFLFNTLLFQEFQRRRRVGCLKVLKNLKALKRHG